MAHAEGPPALADVPELLRQVPISDRARAARKKTASAAEVPQRLFAEQLDLDAVRVLAYALPIRRAVWWGCLCAWHARGKATAAEQERALTAAIDWVMEPTPQAGPAALAAAQSAGLDNAAGLIARAAAAAGHADGQGATWQGAALPLAARAVQGAALYAYLERAKMEPGFTYRPLAALGLQVARGEVLWEAERRLS